MIFLFTYSESHTSFFFASIRQLPRKSIIRNPREIVLNWAVNGTVKYALLCIRMSQGPALGHSPSQTKSQLHCKKCHTVFSRFCSDFFSHEYQILSQLNFIYCLNVGSRSECQIQSAELEIYYSTKFLMRQLS